MWTIYFIGLFVYLSIIPKRVYNYTYGNEKGFLAVFWTCLGVFWPILLGLTIIASTLIILISAVAYTFVPAFRKDMVSFYIDVLEEVKSFLVIKDENNA